MTVDQAQAQIRAAFVDGGPGAMVSALVWLIAGYVYATGTPASAFAALFVGGIFIFPVSVLICKLAFARSGSVQGNPLGLVALESTIAMIGGLLAAWLLLAARPDMVFPVAALAVGTHYFAFKTAYGDRTFWVLGALLTLVAAAAIFLVRGQTLALILAIAIIELAFGLWLTIRSVRAARSGTIAG